MNSPGPPTLVQVHVGRSAELQPGSSLPRPPGEGRRGGGSGFIYIRQDGYLRTNAHVEDKAERIQIKLEDGRHFDGRLVGQDRRVDLALAKIEASGLRVAVVRDSKRRRGGELVLALGHPFGLEQTVPFGIVSRKGAPPQAAEPGFDFIQTDAAGNPGGAPAGPSSPWRAR